MQTHRIAIVFCKAIILTVLAGMVAAVLIRDVEYLRATPQKSGAYPAMICGTYSMPHAKVAGADFGDIYMSARALLNGESAYNIKSKEFVDPFGRPKNYPPLMYWVYTPLSRLEFWPALLIHMSLSLLVAFGASAFVLGKGTYRSTIGWVLLAQACLFFLTPIGLLHIERGQFDLLVASMVALCFACSFLNRGLFIVAIVTGVAAALKWTSLPVIGCFSGLGFLVCSGKRRWAFFILPSMTLLATLGFYHALQEYWTSIRYFDIDAAPCGVTLRHFMSSKWVKVVPFPPTLALGALIWFRAQSAAERERLFRDASAPFILALTNIAICFPAVSYEYHAVTLLGVLPCIVFWLKDAWRVPLLIKSTLGALYVVFCAIVFRVPEQFTAPSTLQMTKIYVAFASVFYAIAVVSVLARKRHVESSSPPVTESANLASA